MKYCGCRQEQAPEAALIGLVDIVCNDELAPVLKAEPIRNTSIILQATHIFPLLCISRGLVHVLGGDHPANIGDVTKLRVQRTDKLLYKS